MRRTALGATLAAGLVIVGVAAGCGSSGSSGSSGSNSGPILVGAALSKTGSYAGDAEFALKGYEYGIDQINKNGGLLGRKLKLVTYDDKSDPGTAVRLYTKLITQDRVNLLLGPYSSGITQAVIPLAEKFKMPMMDDEASSATPFKGTHYSIQGQVSSLKYLPDVVDIAKKRGYKTMALINQNVIATQEICGGVEKEANRVGMKVVYKKDYPTDQTDFSSLVLGAKQANPDVVVACPYLPDSIGIAKEMNQQGLKPKLLAMCIGPVEPDFQKSLGSVANGVITTSAWWPTINTPGNKEFISGYKAKFSEDPDYHAADAYAGVNVMADAIRKAGSLNNDKINQVLHTQSFQTVLGDFKINSSGQQQGYVSYLLQWQNGKLKLVFPESEAESKVQLPYGT